MRRSGTPGKRFGPTALNSPGPSPGIVKSPQVGIQAAHTQHGLPAPSRGQAVFRKPLSPAQIGQSVTHGRAMERTPAIPVNAGRPVSGIGRPLTRTARGNKRKA